MIIDESPKFENHFFINFKKKFVNNMVSKFTFYRIINF